MTDRGVYDNKSQRQNKSKQIIIIILLLIFVPMCVVVTVLGIIGYKGVETVKDVNKDIEIKELIFDIQVSLEEYNIENDDIYPESLNTIKSDLLNMISTLFENVSINGSTVSVEGYTIEYERINLKDYKISTTLHDGKVYEVTSY